MNRIENVRLHVPLSRPFGKHVLKSSDLMAESLRPSQAKLYRFSEVSMAKRTEAVSSVGQ